MTSLASAMLRMIWEVTPYPPLPAQCKKGIFVGSGHSRDAFAEAEAFLRRQYIAIISPPSAISWTSKSQESWCDVALGKGR